MFEKKIQYHLVYIDDVDFLAVESFDSLEDLIKATKGRKKTEYLFFHGYCYFGTMDLINEKASTLLKLINIDVGEKNGGQDVESSGEEDSDVS